MLTFAAVQHRLENRLLGIQMYNTISEHQMSRTRRLGNPIHGVALDTTLMHHVRMTGYIAW